MKQSVRSKQSVRNKEFQTRREKLLADIKRLRDDQFDYSYFKNGRGYPGCVAGWCVYFNFSVFREISRFSTAIRDMAQDYLGLSDSDASILFFYRSGQATKVHAVKRLQWLVDHGSFADYPKEKEVY